MSCINITPLVLSDTFNTWFERTNESISALNSFEIRGLSASTTDGVRGLKFVDAGSCYYSLALETGPFIGFVTGEGVDKGIYGTGDATSPYKLTFVASGPTMSAEAVTGDDYALVSDTSDGGLFKLAPVNSFVTNIVGGNNISVTLTNGTYTISYVEITFTPTFTVNPIETTKEIGVGTLLNNATLTFTITSGSSDVDVASASVKLVDDTPSGRFSGVFGTVPVTIINGSGTYVTPAPITVPHNTDWFNLTNTSIQFTASLTSDTQTNGDPPTNTPATNTTITRTYSFGWAFRGYSSTSLLDSSEISAQSGSFVNLGGASTFYTNPTTKRQFTIPVASSAEHYVYFIHSSSQTGGAGDTFGWSPTFYNDTGAFEIVGGATELTTTALGGPITVGGKKYRVWRINNTYTQDFTFQVG
jgi:hypothetical protein